MPQRTCRSQLLRVTCNLQPLESASVYINARQCNLGTLTAQDGAAATRATVARDLVAWRRPSIQPTQPNRGAHPTWRRESARAQRAPPGERGSRPPALARDPSSFRGPTFPRCSTPRYGARPARAWSHRRAANSRAATPWPLSLCSVVPAVQTRVPLVRTVAVVYDHPLALRWRSPAATMAVTRRRL